jgi:hypothetical protein
MIEIYNIEADEPNPRKLLNFSSIWDIMMPWHLMVTPPQKRTIFSIYEDYEGYFRRTSRVDLPELVFIGYQYMYKSHDLFVPYLRSLYFIKKDKDNILNSIVSPILSPNCSEVTGDVCLGYTGPGDKEPVKDAPNYLLNKYFSTEFHYSSDSDRYDLYRESIISFEKEYHNPNPLSSFLPWGITKFPLKVTKVQ